MNGRLLALVLVLPLTPVQTHAQQRLPIIDVHLHAAPAPFLSEEQKRDLAITHVNVIDVADGSVRPDQTVLISGSRIAALGPSQDVRLAEGAEVIDARGRYLIPGLWDTHAHVASAVRLSMTFATRGESAR